MLKRKTPSPSAQGPGPPSSNVPTDPFVQSFWSAAARRLSSALPLPPRTNPSLPNWAWLNPAFHKNPITNSWFNVKSYDNIDSKFRAEPWELFRAALVPPQPVIKPAPSKPKAKPKVQPNVSAKPKAKRQKKEPFDLNATVSQLNANAKASNTNNVPAVPIKVRTRKKPPPKPPDPVTPKAAKPKAVKPSKPPPVGVKKIKLYPTAEQASLLRRWFGTARWTYNRVLSTIKDHNAPIQKKVLRAACVDNSLWASETSLAWVSQTPYDIRNEAMTDVIKAYQSNFAKNTGKKFELKYRSRKRQTQDSIVIHSKHWFKGIIYKNAWVGDPIKTSEPLPDTLAYDARLLWNMRLNEFYLCVPRAAEMRRDNQAPPRSTVIALDPGLRTFQTTYSPDGRSLEFGRDSKVSPTGKTSKKGNGGISRIMRLCLHLDKLQSKWSQPDVRHRKRYTMKRAGARIRKKIQDLVLDIHHKTAKFLCENYQVVLVPLFETKHMVCRLKERLGKRNGSKTARMMMTWSHYRFRQILLSKAKEYPWCQVLVVNEAYTSKTCGQCGFIHQKLGSDKVFKCPRCKVELDRDVNGARNILLRFLSTDTRSSGFRAQFFNATPSGVLGAWPLLPPKGE